MVARDIFIELPVLPHVALYSVLICAVALQGWTADSASAIRAEKGISRTHNTR